MSSLWTPDRPLLLASTSATRLLLLQSAGLPVETRSPDVDERSIETSLRDRHLASDAIALELARAKGAHVSGRWPDRLVVAADQTLSLGSKQFHKPANLHEAHAQLRELSGKTHALNSAVVCYRNGQEIFSHIATARLTMWAFGDDFVTGYLAMAGDSVTRSVGGYQVEALGVHLFSRIDGDHSTILGLPLLPLLAFLRSTGAVGYGESICSSSD